MVDTARVRRWLEERVRETEGEPEWWPVEVIASWASRDLGERVNVPVVGFGFKSLRVEASVARGTRRRGYHLRTPDGVREWLLRQERLSERKREERAGRRA